MTPIIANFLASSDARCAPNQSPANQALSTRPAKTNAGMASGQNKKIAAIAHPMLLDGLGPGGGPGR